MFYFNSFIHDCSKVIGNVALFQYLGPLVLTTCFMYTVINVSRLLAIIFLKANLTSKFIVQKNPTAYIVYICVMGVLVQFFIYCFLGQLITDKVYKI